MKRIFLMIAVLAQLTGCIATPRIEIPDKLTFDVLPPEQFRLSYDDLLCCFDCTVKVT